MPPMVVVVKQMMTDWLIIGRRNGAWHARRGNCIGRGDSPAEAYDNYCDLITTTQ